MIKSFYAFLIFLFILMIASTAFSAEKGTIKVVVIDDEEAVLPGVSLTLSSPVMMGEKTLITNAVGEVLFVNLTPGIYEVKANLQGFQEKISRDIEVSLDRQTFVKIVLKPAVIEESVTVTAVYPAVDTTKSVIAEHVTHETVESLPIARDFVGYLQLAAGVNMVPNSQGRDTPEDPTGKGGINYNPYGLQGVQGGGKRGSRDNFYFLDGMNITGLSSQTALMTFNNEVIQEQELMTSGVPAEYGGGKGVVGNIVTKAGGNRLSGSANFYYQPKNFYLPYGGSEYDKADDPTMLEGYKDNKYDSAFTLGGPIMKDRLWFFVSGQYRNNSDKFNLSESASSIREEVDYIQKRTGAFGKLSFKLSPNDSFTFLYFLDDFSIEGDRNKNTIKTRHSKDEYKMGVYSAYYQRVFSNNIIIDLRYGHYWWSHMLGPRYPEAGTPDNLHFLPGTYPRIEEHTFGGYPSGTDDDNTRDQFSASAEWYLGNMRLKAGIMYTNEYDKDDNYYHYGEEDYSLDSNLSGITLGELLDAGVFPWSEFHDKVLFNLNYNWDSTSDALDLNSDGVVSVDELRQLKFIDTSEHGLYFTRRADVKRGANKVHVMRWTGYIMNDWKINNYFTLNAGVRIEDHNNKDSEGGEICHLKPTLLPRIGLVWNIGGRGTHKLTVFYGQFSDPLHLGMVHFAGNISGRVRSEDIWINGNWYTYLTRGSPERRTAVWVPNIKNPLSHEFSLTHEIDLGDGLVIASQAYYRGDRRITEDYNVYSYVLDYPGHPVWGKYALTWEDFGYGPEGPATATFFITNLIGGKRDFYGFDFELSKRFENGSYIVGQYSFKHQVGNTMSDGSGAHQGDLIEYDPRTPWMWGPLPGSIPHMVKIFGSYRTPFGLDIGALFFWNGGMIYTESFDYLHYECYMNWPLNNEWTDFVQLGQEKTPAYYQLDLKINYGLRLMDAATLHLFLDIYNITNNQAAFDVQYARNDPAWDYQETTEILLPMRFYVGARIRF
jgi:hypothetical protein